MRLARRGVPPKGHWSSDCVFPSVRPNGCIVAQNGILCANDIPLKDSLEDEIGPKGCSPEGPLARIGLNRRKTFMETNFKNQKTKGRHHQTNNQRTKRRTISQDHQRPSSTTTNPNHDFIPKVEGGFLKTQNLTLENKGSNEHFFVFSHVVNVPHEAP